MAAGAVYKLVIIGDAGVGKSALTIRFIQGRFEAEYEPTVEDKYRKEYTIDGIGCMVDVLDTAGQENYGTMRDHYLLSGDGFLGVYSITSEKSLDNLKGLCKSILRVKEIDDLSELALVIVGNKCDLEKEREVEKLKAESLASEYHCPIYESSAKTNTNVEQSFFQLVREIRRVQSLPPKKPAAAAARDRKDSTEHRPEGKEKKCSLQ